VLYRVGRLAGRGQLREVNGGQFQGAPNGQGLPQHSGAEISLAQYTAPPGAVSTDMDPDATWSQQSGIAGDPCCAGPATCTPPPPRHYIAVDALGWWVKSDQLPPLVTTSPIGTPAAIAGV